jgi:2-haloacid dehalogenase
MPRVIVFDVNETLLDLRAFDPHFEHLFGDAAVRKEWFNQVLQSGLVTTVLGTYHDFGAVAGAALDMTAARHGVALSADDRAQLLGTIKSLPPHPDVREGLMRLREAGLRLATLTNSTVQVAQAQLQNAGLVEFFEQILSADSARHLKPAAEAYTVAAARLGEPVGHIRLVAAHAWDVAGALNAGCTAAFIARPGMVLEPLATKPDIIGKDLREVSEQILAAEKS